MSGAVTFTPTPEDWIAANRLWYRRSRMRRMLAWLGVAAITLLLVAGTFSIALAHKALSETSSDLASVAVFAIVVFSIPALTLRGIPRQVRRQFSQRPAMSDETRYTWTDDGLEGVTRTGTTVQRWSELHRQLRDDRSFIFLMTDNMLLLIPRRALTEAQADDLAATADRFGPALG